MAIIGANLGEGEKGTAYVFEWDASQWNEVGKLAANDGETEDNFGVAVAISDDFAIVGAEGDDLDAGSAYLFIPDNNTWSEFDKIVLSDRLAEDDFGVSIGISGDDILVGTRGLDRNSGAVFLYENPFVETSIGRDFLLEMNTPDTDFHFTSYPNPFSSSTTIEYESENTSYMEVGVIDILGRKIHLLFEGYAHKGYIRTLGIVRRLHRSRTESILFM